MCIRSAHQGAPHTALPVLPFLLLRAASPSSHYLPFSSDDSSVTSPPVLPLHPKFLGLLSPILHSFHKYFLSTYYMPGFVLDVEETRRKIRYPLWLRSVLSIQTWWSSPEAEVALTWLRGGKTGIRLPFGTSLVAGNRKGVPPCQPLAPHSKYLSSSHYVLLQITWNSECKFHEGLIFSNRLIYSNISVSHTKCFSPHPKISSTVPNLPGAQSLTLISQLLFQEIL